MTPWRLAARTFLRGLRAGRLTVLMLALTVAVAAITSVGFFIDRVRVSVEREAASVLAADLRIGSNDPLNPDYRAEAERMGLATAEVASFPTVAHSFFGRSGPQSPRLAPRSLFSSRKRYLSADRYAGLQIRWTNDLHDRRCGHQFDPEGIPVPEPGSLLRLAQCVQAALLFSGGCFGETREVKDDP